MAVRVAEDEARGRFLVSQDSSLTVGRSYYPERQWAVDRSEYSGGIMDAVAETRAKVQHYLTKNGRVEIDQDGDFTFRAGSSRVFIRVVDWGDSDTVVSVWAVVAGEVPVTPALFEFVATTTDDYMMGHLGCQVVDDGTALITFNHRVLGNVLDEEALHARSDRCRQHRRPNR